MEVWIKVAHIVSIISWMAGLLYLPRLMVYHAATEIGTHSSETFKVMERRLYQAIMTPAMISSWFFGLVLASITHAYDTGWFIFKLFLVVILTAFHFFCGLWVKEFYLDQRKRKQRFYRFANEFPTLVMVFVIILVVVKPF